MIIQEEKSEIIDNKKKLPTTEAVNTKQETNSNESKTMSNFKTSKKHIILYFLYFIFAIVLILTIIFGIFTIYNFKHNNVITKGIYIYGIDVSNLSKNEAKEKLSKTFDKIQKTDIHLYYGEGEKKYETYINPTEIELKFDIDAAINYAYNIGKKGNIFYDNFDIFDTMVQGLNITPIYTLDDSALTSLLDNLSKDLPDAVVESSYYVEKSNLIITKGKKGYIVNTTETQKDIKNSLTTLDFLNNPIELKLTEKSPTPINLDKIYSEIHKPAEDAYFISDPYELHPSSTGTDFKISLTEAKEKLKKSENECTIPLKTVYPKKTTNMIGKEAFPNLLATFSTKYAASNKNRTTNLQLAANKINGTVLMPGEKFSYNKIVGERTIAAGYKDAAIYLNGQVVDGLGGGICQISTTLFNAVLFANLKIEEIHNHQFVPSYVGAGRDATVVYGAKDFQFSNSRKYPIKIECSVSKGIAKFNIYGVKEKNEYTVDVSAKITSQTSSYTKATTTRILKKNGKTISTEKIYNSTYKKH